MEDRKEKKKPFINILKNHYYLKADEILRVEERKEFPSESKKKFDMLFPKNQERVIEEIAKAIKVARRKNKTPTFNRIAKEYEMDEVELGYIASTLLRAAIAHEMGMTFITDWDYEVERFALNVLKRKKMIKKRQVL